MCIKKIIIILLTGFVLTSCFKEVDFIKLDPLESITVINNIQETQSYYKIEENEIRLVDFNYPISWDLGFETGEDGWHIIINYSTAARIINTQITDINDVDVNTVIDLLPVVDGIWKFDHQNGDPDSTAIGNWVDSASVYVLYRGGVFDNIEAYYKLFIESVNADEYVIHYADMNNCNEIITKTITKDNSISYVTFSLTTGERELIDPGKNEWDLLFTPYYGWYETLTPGVFLPFYMSGVYVNYLNGVEVARIDDAAIDYNDIDYTYIEQYDFSDDQDVIGQDWKLIPQPPDYIYLIDDNIKFIIHAIDSNYYKFRFRNFYNEDGEKGYPEFEYKIL